MWRWSAAAFCLHVITQVITHHAFVHMFVYQFVRARVRACVALGLRNRLGRLVPHIFRASVGRAHPALGSHDYDMGGWECVLYLRRSVLWPSFVAQHLTDALLSLAR
jgi:hypothetical protein